MGLVQGDGAEAVRAGSAAQEQCGSQAKQGSVCIFHAAKYTMEGYITRSNALQGPCMNRAECTAQIRSRGIIAIVRAGRGGDDLVRVVEAIAGAGVGCVEVTLNTPGAEAAIAAAVRQLAGVDVLIGAGTVLDAAGCQRAIDAGAQYIVCPVTTPSVIEAAHAADVPVLPGAFTPNEIVHAWELGADLVKLFPATLGGLEYMKAVRAPLPHIPLVPTGGVTPENLHLFLSAGAAAVGVGNAIVTSALVEARAFDTIAANARRFADAFAAARNDAARPPLPHRESAPHV